MFTYRKYTAKDTSVYKDSLEIRNALLRAPIGKNIYLENLNIEKDNQFFGAFNMNELIGTLSYFEEKSQIAHLTVFAVKKEYQKQGVGKKLLTFLYNDLKSKNFKLINVDAREEATTFYEKCGFDIKSGPILNEKLNVIDFKMSYIL